MEESFPGSRDLGMFESEAKTALTQAEKLLELLNQDSDDDEEFIFLSAEAQSPVNEEHSDYTMVKQESSEEPAKVKEETRTITMKSSRREDDLSGYDRYSPRAAHRESPLRSIRRKYANSTTTPHSPVSAPFHWSPNKRSPPIGMSIPNYLSTPTADLASTPSNSSEGIYHGSKETVVNDAGSLERNVSSLNIAKDGIKKETPTLTRENHLLRNPTLPAPQSNRADFIPPAAVVRGGNHQEYVSQSNKERTGRPKTGDLITISDCTFRIVRQVGNGASGIVYQVLDIETKEIFALKWIELRRAEDRQSVMDEIKLLNSLKGDENIVQLLAYKETPRAVYIVMEYGEIDFKTLLKNQEDKRWDINFIRYYWSQMLHAVLAIHRSNIVHTDLKPANFVVCRGFLKLIDFGIAERMSDDTTNIRRDTQIGTWNYMAPEALTDLNEGRDGVDFLIKQGRASDVWSLGCILYQMVYGYTPFHYEDTAAKKHRSITDPNCQIKFPKEILHSEPPQKITVPDVLIKVLQLCLNRNPALRPTTTELIMHQFVN